MLCTTYICTRRLRCHAGEGAAEHLHERQSHESTDDRAPRRDGRGSGRHGRRIGLLGAAVAGGDDQAESNPATLTTEEEGTDSPEDPSGLEQTNSFGYIPSTRRPSRPIPSDRRVAASRTTRSNSAAGASTRPSSSRCPQTRPSPPRPVERRRHMTPTNHSPLPRRIAVGAVAALAVASLGLAGCDRASQTANHGFPQQPTSTTDETGLQQTNSFGYIPEHETTLPTNGNGPGAPARSTTTPSTIPARRCRVAPVYLRTARYSRTHDPGRVIVGLVSGHGLPASDGPRHRGSRGLGAAIARELAPTHQLILGGRSAESLEQIVGELGAAPWPVDLTTTRPSRTPSPTSTGSRCWCTTPASPNWERSRRRRSTCGGRPSRPMWSRWRN